MSAAQYDDSKGQTETGQAEKAAADAAASVAAPLARIERVQLFLPLQAQAPSRSQPCETPARPDPPAPNSQAPNPPATDPSARLVARLIALLEEVMDLTQSRRGSAMPTLFDSLTVEIFRSADDPGPNQTPDQTPGTRPPQG